MFSDHVELDWLKKWARYSPDHVALKDADSGRSVTYGLFYSLAVGLAAEMSRRYSLKRGDRVAVLATNELDYLPLFYALQRMGVLMVPVNVRLAPREIEHILRDSESSLLISQAQFASAIERIDPAVRKCPHWSFDGEESLTSLLASFTKAYAAAPFVFTEHAFAGSADEPCMILYTSGTTGAPKGALITPKLMFWNSVNTALSLGLTQADVHVAFSPFFHTGGWNVLLTPFIHHGATTVLLSKFEPERVVALSESEEATLLFGVPTTMEMMSQAKAFATADLSRVRYAIVGGEPMPIPLIHAWGAKGVPVRQGYGMTEFGPNNFSLPPRDAIRKAGSIGFANFYVQTRIVDNEGVDVAAGEIGELWLRGPACFPGYWRNETATREALAEDWYHTGDLVRSDDEGYFYVAGRKKDMFISGAENVYPVEVETFLRTHPKVRDVAVVGVPDTKWGEVGKAFIVLHEGHSSAPNEILQFCDGNLARYKIPKHVEFIAALPKGDSGKVLKRELPR